jgi:hypothetical protein
MKNKIINSAYSALRSVLNTVGDDGRDGAKTKFAREKFAVNKNAAGFQARVRRKRGAVAPPVISP